MPPALPKRSILLVNPWIHDFAAYDLWVKPLGLLCLASLLRSRKYEVSLLDFVNLSSWPREWTMSLRAPRRKIYGHGHFFQELIPKPEALRNIKRRYRRYGLPPELVKRRISTLPRPEVILITSLMTYWYPGLLETIEFLKQHLPGVPVLLGGIYATLCPSHAEKYSGADRVLPGPLDSAKMKAIGEFLGESNTAPLEDFPSWPFPAFDLYARLDYICLLTRWGCPFACTYCAVPRLMPGFKSRDPLQVVGEIRHWQRWGIVNFAFYDDALLIRPREHIIPILKEIVRGGIRVNFHAPNALHIRAIDEEVAGLLFRSGFKTIRLGLETTHENQQLETGGKVTNQEFQRAIRNLRKAGYTGNDLGVYLLAGLPGQRAGEVRESLAYVREAGARPILVEYSPIPGTPLFEKAKGLSPFDLENEPLYHNNSIFPCRWEGFTCEDYQRLKIELKEAYRGG